MTPAVIAQLILDGFDEYRNNFRLITAQAKIRFERADWHGVQQAGRDRIKLYHTHIQQIVRQMDARFSDAPLTEKDWQEVKRAYIRLTAGRADCDLAETVYNTVIRKSENGQGLSDDCAFVANSFAEPDRPLAQTGLISVYGPSTDLSTLFAQIFLKFQFATPFEDLQRDIRLMVDTMQARIPLLRNPGLSSQLSMRQEVRFEVMNAVFYRNKGAYLIGRMRVKEHQFPIAIPLHNNGAGVFVDTIIWNENDLSLIFSFTRAYFMVDAWRPSEMVTYLHGLLPNKKRWELYNALGLHKHGKTEFYREFVTHLENSDDQFVIAEGIKGLVMTVFTLPSYQMVFKVIRDRFSPTKKVTRKQVKEAYDRVKTHDRVGRMADTQEFTELVLPKHRFSDELLEELTQVAASMVSITDQHLIIRHLYTERLMTPLNLYIKDKSDYELRMALDEYGNAIKQLAAANIFPGDMLLKNFGVTRHGRVVFYDYDELCYLTEVNFREIPAPLYPEDELAAEPWYSVGPNDVFPEEFKTFLFNSQKLRKLFCEYHEDLFSADYWRGLQTAIRQEQIADVFPYRRKRRFAQT